MNAAKKPAGKTAAAIGAGLILASAALMAFLGRWEGDQELTVYADNLAKGLPTVCKGLTRYITTTPIVVGEKWTAEKCEAEERQAITKVQSALLRCFRRSPSQTVFDAATSHAWNVGVASTCNSGAMQAWNRGEWAIGCRRIHISDAGKPVWSYVKTGRKLANGEWEMKFVQGLANRRQAEYRVCIGAT